MAARSKCSWPVVGFRSKGAWHDQIADWLAACGDAGEAVNLVVLHAWLAQEASYSGSLLSLQRYVHARIPEAPAAGASAGRGSAGGPSTG